MQTLPFQRVAPIMGRYRQTLICLVLVAAFATLPAMASSFVITNLSDSGAGSLRQAILDANGDSVGAPHTITFDSSLNGTVQLGSALPTVYFDTTLDGPGSGKVTITRNSATEFRILTSAASALTVNGLTITNGVAVDGGGIYSSGALTVNGCVIISNSAIGPDSYFDGESNHSASSGHGGGLYASGNMVVSGSTISANLAKGGDDAIGTTGIYGGNGNGGGIYGGSDVTISYSAITGNAATGGSTQGDDSGEGIGGGIYVNGRLTVTYTSISGNTANGGDVNGEALSRAAAGRGGGIYSLGNSSFANASVTGNTATGGGGAAGYGNALGGGMDANTASSVVEISDSDFSDNHLVGTVNVSVGGHAYGSAIRCYYSYVDISRSKFTGNTALSNDAEYVVGSALDLFECESNIRNSLVAQNVASGNATYTATVLVEAGFLFMSNCTIADNSTVGTGAAVFAYVDTTEVINSILWGNSQDQFLEMDVDYGVTYSSSGFEGSPGITYSDIENGYGGTGNMNQDPLFVDAANQNYELLPTSPAIDSALASEATSTDLLGNPRMDDLYSYDSGGGFVDMGAYEYQPDDYISQLIGLQVGWNLISVPFVPLDSSIAGNFGSDAFAYRWDATIQDYAEITTITAGQGFFLYTETGSSVQLYSQTPGTSSVQRMENYWNVIGPTEDGQTFDAVSNVIVVYTYDGYSDSYNLVNPTDGTYTLYAGIGYYLFAFPAFDLTLSTKSIDIQY